MNLIKLKKIKKVKGKKAVSGVVTAVLLIAITLVLASIVFLWIRAFVKEAVVKSGKNVELVCEDVSFKAEYSSSKVLLISNDGNVALSNLNLKIIKEGSFTTISLDDSRFGITGFNGLNSGASLRQDLTNLQNNPLDNAKSIIFIPIIKGKTQNGQVREYVCPENYGREVVIG